MSSADDIDAAADQQGAGLLDTERAVREAESPAVGSGGAGTSPSATGVLVSTSAPSGTRPGQLDVTGSAGTSADQTVSVTNTGSSDEIVTPQLRRLTDVLSTTPGQVPLDGDSGTTDLTIAPGGGGTDAYKAVTFTVPAGTDELTGQFSWSNPDGGQVVQMALVDPSGRFPPTAGPCRARSRTAKHRCRRPSRGPGRRTSRPPPAPAASTVP